MASGNWSDLPNALGGDSAVSKLTSLLNSDAQFKAFVASEAITSPVTFGIKSAGSDHTILVTFSNGKGEAKSSSSAKEALFTLQALPEQWEQFFKPVPSMPYQSYWGMFGMNIKKEGIEVAGNQEGFAVWSHVWRRALDLLKEAVVGPQKEDDAPEDTDRDWITGHYVYITAPVWGKCKIFVERSGEGKQPILFLHTAGSDGRQYHGVMNDKRMRNRTSMIAVDLPGHGRSFPPRDYVPGTHTNTEDAYVGFIAAVVKELGLKRPIVCGASMAGQVCLAVAARADEVGAAGTIPLQGYVIMSLELYKLANTNDHADVITWI